MKIQITVIIRLIIYPTFIKATDRYLFQSVSTFPPRGMRPLALLNYTHSSRAKELVVRLTLNKRAALLTARAKTRKFQGKHAYQWPQQGDRRANYHFSHLPSLPTPPPLHPSVHLKSPICSSPRALFIPFSCLF